MEETKEIRIKIPTKLNKLAKEKKIDIQRIIQNALTEAVKMDDFIKSYNYSEVKIPKDTPKENISTDDIAPGKYIYIENLDLEGYERIVDETKWEYINGILIHHSPESNHHNAIFVYLMHKLTSSLQNDQYIIRASRVALNIGKNKPEPDIMVFDRNDFRRVLRKDGSKSDIVDSTPLIVIEIVSATSKEHDRKKTDLFLKKGIKEYWQIFSFEDPNKVCVLQLKGDSYEENFYDCGEVRSRILPTFAIKIEELSDPDSSR